MEHRSLVSTLAAAQRAFGFGAVDRVPSLATYAFDIWLFKTPSPLLCGSTVRPVARERVPDPAPLVDDLARCTAVHAVTDLMRAREVRAFTGGSMSGMRQGVRGR